jgi:hypothetical protein
MLGWEAEGSTSSLIQKDFPLTCSDILSAILSPEAPAPPSGSTLTGPRSRRAISGDRRHDAEDHYL